MVIPPPQLNAAPVVVEDAVKVSVGDAQVIGEGAAILALGAVIFCVTVVEAVFVQPLEASVAVTA